MADELNRAAPIAAQLDQDAERAAFEVHLGRPLMSPTNPTHYNGRDARSAWAAWQASAARRADPVAAQLDADNLPPLPPHPSSGAFWHDWSVAEKGAILQGQQQAYQRGRMDAISDYQSAVEEAVAPYAERIRHLERDLADWKESSRILSESRHRWKEAAKRCEQPAQSIGDDPEFQRLLLADEVASPGRGDGAHMRAAYDNCRAALIAHIDGRTAGTASEELRKTVNAHCNDLLDCAAILHDDGRFKATAAEIRVAVAELKSALAAAPSTQEGAK